LDVQGLYLCCLVKIQRLFGLGHQLMTDVDPYRARGLYVKYADALLQNIPGEHQARMPTWRKWDKHQSPPLAGYPNRAWQKAHPQEAIVDGGVEIVQSGVHGLQGGAENALISNPLHGAQGNDALTETSSLASLGLGPVAESHDSSLKHLAIMGGTCPFVSG
jgi:hypothetical protein